MGARNPDRIPLRDRWSQGRTVADMARAGWDVLSICQRCGLTMQTDLKLIAFVCGPATTLWNRHAPCRRLGCPGAVHFFAKAPGMNSHERLAFDTREIEHAPGWAQRRLREVKERREP